ESTTYVDGSFERWRDGGSGAANDHLHIRDGEERLAVVRRGPPHPRDAGPAVQYVLADHLGSASVVLDDARAWVNREEFTPYGETAFGGFARKRYRFTGQERDEESGLAYHQARYYAPALARWVSTDPAGPVDGLGLYAYAAANPLRISDRTGTQAHDEAG